MPARRYHEVHRQLDSVLLLLPIVDVQIDFGALFVIY